MKHLNFLSKSSSQSCGHNVVTLASTVGSPSAHRRGTMLKLLSVLVLVFTFGVGQMWGADPTKTETFESATVSTTYNSTKTITTSQSSCGIGWSIYYGSPSTTQAITGDNSCLMRYYTASSSNLGYAATTTAIKGLKNVTFNAKVTNTGNKMGVWYSTDGETWTAIATDVTLTTSSASKSYDIPSSSASTDYYIKIGITAGTTNKKDLIIDDVVFTYAANTPSYTITEQSNNNSLGTVSLDGSVITGSPATCCEYASPAYTVTPEGKATVTQGTGNKINEFTVSSLTDDVTVTINFQAKNPGKTVKFDAGAGNYTGGDLTEDCVGSGITLPSATATSICKGWTTFAGWATSAVTDSSTTEVTLYSSPYVPNTNNQILYAVYSKDKSGASSTETIAAADLGVSNSTAIGTKTVGTITIKGEKGNNGTSTNVPKYYSAESSIRCYASNDLTISSTNTISQIDFTYDGSYNGGTITPNSGAWASTATTNWDQTWQGSTTSVKFRVGNSQWRVTNIKVTTGGGSTTYYVSDPNCCESLGQINGSVSLSQTTATLTWDKLANVGTWAVTYKADGGSESSANVTISDQDANHKQAEITGLTPNTHYTFYITASGATGYCETSKTWSDLKGSTDPSWTITASTNNALYGSVSREGSVITGTPELYCTYANPAYTLTGNATVTQNGNDFTITDQAEDITIVINFEPIPVTGVTMSSDAETLEVGGEVTLTATVNPNTVNPNVTWTSSDPTVATVSNGTVTATQKAGTTTITATSVGDNTKSATCTVTVVPVTDYKKVTANLDDWSGDYLLVYEPEEGKAWVWNGEDATSCYAEVDIPESGKITKPAAGVKLVLDALTGDNAGKYSIKIVGGTHSGMYLDEFNTSNASIKFAESAVPATLSYDGENHSTQFTTANKYMRFNKAVDQKRFRGYASNGQEPVQLYRKVVASAVTITDPAEGTGLLTLANEQTAVASGDNIEAGSELTVTATPNSGNHYIGGTVTVTKTVGGDDVTAAVYSNGTITMPEYAITVSATFTPTYAITKVADGGSIALSYTQGDAEEGYATAGTSVTATATADGSHVFTSISLSNNVENPSISGNVATFTMPASAVTVTAEFAVKQDPSIAVTDGTNPITALNFGSVAKTSDPVAQTFKLSGLNLAQGTLTIVSSDDTKFTVSPTSINVDGTLEETTVTVTPVTSVAGTFNDEFIMISGGGLAQADEVMIGLSLTVQETYTAKWYVNGAEQLGSTVTGIAGTALTFPDAPTPTGNCAGTEFMGWLTAPLEEASATAPDGLITTHTGHTMPAANVNYYAVFAEEGVGAPASVMTEDFASITTGNSTSTSGSSNHWTPNTNFNQTKNNVFEAGGAIRLGKTGSLETKSLDLSSGAVTVNFKLKGWSNSEYTVSVQVDNQTVQSATCTGYIGSGDFESKSLTFDAGTTASTVKFTTSSGVRVFVDDIDIQVPGVSYSNYVTTCVACSNVSLVEAGETNGTITLKQGSKAVSSVKTCNGAVTLTTNAVAETGYELTNIALNGVANATVNQEMTEITIPANATGELTVTATFSQKNYEVALAQSPAAGATLDGATTTAHYNATINISTTVPDGYMFAGWTPANLFANTEAANAISTSFTMPNDDVTVTANFTQIYTVADALALVPEAGDNSDYVYVGGLISYVDETSWDEKYKNINYYISANGTRENELLVYHGYKGYDKETFDAITNIKAGDKVIVYGKLTNYQGTKEFAQNNQSGVYSYIYQFTEAILSSVEVGGTLTKTDYFINDDFTREGLTATAVYSNTGYSKDITDEATWTNDLAGGKVTEDGTVRVTATYNTVPGYKDVEVTVTTKVLESIELSETALTGYLGQAVQKPATVTAHFDDNGVKTTENVTAFASFDDSDYDATSTAEQTITVSYQFGNAPAQTADYTITLSSIRNTIETAYTVEKGRSIIDLDNLAENNLELDDEGNKVFVQGYITDITNNKYTIKDNIEDTEFIEISEGTLGDGISSVKVGDLIKVEGNLYFYENNSHTVKKHQILNGEIVAVVRTPNLTVADVAEMEVNFTADLAEADLTIDKDGSNGDITFACTDPAVTIVNNKLHAAAAGDATVTATMAANGIYTEASTTFNVHVIAERQRYAVNFDANGGSGDAPVVDNQLPGVPVDLPATCPYSKANSAFDAWVVTETESGDAVAVTDGHFTMPAAAVTIKATWTDVETCAISFMVSGSEVATADAPQTVAYSLAEVSHPAVDGFTFLGWSETEYDDEVTTLPTTISSYTPEVGESTKTLYGIYSQVVGGENQHYVLDYADEELGDNGDWGAYATAYHYTAADGGEWTIKAYKLSGMQINTSKSAYIKVPECPANIIQISLTCNDGAKNPVKFCATASDNATSLADGSNTTSQTLDLSSKSVTTGYIIPTGNCQITHIDVEYSGNVTYYTSSPITRYNVTYAKGDATGVTGLCEAQRHAAGNITLCDAPTCADKNFAKWSDGTSLYAAGAQYTLSADVTFTATWTPKPKYTVTYTANGGTGTAPDVEEYMEDETVTVKENEYFSKPGFVYAGWQVVYNDGENDHIITPDEESEFTMVAYNVTIKALWEEPSNQKWVRVESTDELKTDGTKYIIVGTSSDVAMTSLITGSNKNYYNYTTVVKTGNYLNGPESMTQITLEEGSESGKFAIKNGSKYIYSTTAKNMGERDESFEWTIGISNGVATISAEIGNLKYNSSSPRFNTYASGQQDVAIYREKAMKVIDTNDMTEADVNTNDDVEIAENKTWTVSNDKTVGDVYMKEGAVIANSATVTANDLYFKARHGKSNQIFDLSKITVVSNMYYDFQLCDGDLDADYWYSIAVPFDVDLNSGVFQADGSPMTNRVDFEVWGYDTQLRAQTQSNGWKRVTDNMMHAGKAYLIGFNPGQPNIIRLKAAANWKDHLFSGTSMSVESTGSGDHDNWNGLANPTMRYIDVNKKTEVFNNNTHGWDSYDPEALSFNFVVGTAFFVQSDEAVTISNTDHGNYRAPKRENENKCAYAVRITRDEAESFDNQIIVRASEEATGEYTQGHDMLTMNNATSKTAAMLWTENYGGKRLAIEEAAWLNGTASYVLKMFAPAAGTYSISVAEAKANADLYLTYEGNIIWNLSESAYPIDLKKGTTEGYGLLLNAKMPMTPTGVDEVQSDKVQCTKVVIDEHVYILRGGQMYDVTGKAVK